MFVYLDNSATTRQNPLVTDEMSLCMTETFGNPSSLHRLGMEAEQRLRLARKRIGLALSAPPEEIIFTSGGTEANNLALFGCAKARKLRGNRIVTTAVEHPAVMECCKALSDMGFEVVYMGVDRQGRLLPEEMQILSEEGNILVSVMQINNETGTIMSLSDVASMKKGETVLHTDAVQGFGKIPAPACADLVTVSSHKIHGPKGMGALRMRKNLSIQPILFGGGQEKGIRSGTENLPAISAFGLAAELAEAGRRSSAERMSASRRYLLEGIQAEIGDVRINSVEEVSVSGESGYSSPGILNASFLGTRGEVILHALESHDIFVSTGAACSSHKKGKSHVLTAMGLSDGEIESALRFSFCGEETEEQMDYVLYKLVQEVKKFRKLGSFR